jgi:L-fuculose-phosphate aldolase
LPSLASRFRSACCPKSKSGSQAFADTILPYVKKSNVIILANHGTVSFGETVEKAYWWTEILDAYCRILMLARDLGKVNYFTEGKERELLELKTKWGYSDARLAPGMENCDICANDVFRDSWTDNGIERRAFEPPPSMRPGASSPVPQRKPAPSVDQEALIQTITERVMAALQAK